MAFRITKKEIEQLNKTEILNQFEMCIAVGLEEKRENGEVSVGINNSYVLLKNTLLEEFELYMIEKDVFNS